MADEFTNQAVGQALKDLEENLIQNSRMYEDAQRTGDPVSAADALRAYTAAMRDYNELSGRNQPQQNGQLSVKQQNFLSRRAALGDDVLNNPARMKDYARGHNEALRAGLEPDSAAYFSAVEKFVDHLGDGRQEILNERSAAKICGLTDEEYALQAQKMYNMKARGEIS